MKIYGVYEYYSRIKVFEGSFLECAKWILDHCEIISEKKIFRTWEQNEKYYYDVGTVYYIHAIG